MARLFSKYTLATRIFETYNRKNWVLKIIALGMCGISFSLIILKGKGYVISTESCETEVPGGILSHTEGLSIFLLIACNTTRGYENSACNSFLNCIAIFFSFQENDF